MKNHVWSVIKALVTMVLFVLALFSIQAGVIMLAWCVDTYGKKAMFGIFGVLFVITALVLRNVKLIKISDKHGE